MSRKAVSTDEYEVEKILDIQKKKNGSVIYKVKWVGYDICDSTWEPEENLENAKELIQNYTRELENHQNENMMLIKIAKPKRDQQVKNKPFSPIKSDILSKKRTKDLTNSVKSSDKKKEASVEKKKEQIEVDLSQSIVLEGNLAMNSPLKIAGVIHNKKNSTYDYFVEWKANSAGIKPRESKIDSFEFVKHRPDFLVSFLESNIKIKK